MESTAITTRELKGWRRSHVSRISVVCRCGGGGKEPMQSLTFSERTKDGNVGGHYSVILVNIVSYLAVTPIT